MKSRTVFTAFCLLLAGLGLFFAPVGARGQIRGAISDLLRPGLQAVRVVQDRFGWKKAVPNLAPDTTESGEVARLTEELEQANERNRMLQIRMARIAEREIAERQVSDAISKSERLIVPSLLEAAVLGDTIAEQWRSGKLIDQGAKNGLRENELVLSSRKPVRSLIDVGEDASVSVEDALLLGRCVIGKVEHVGRWTSTIQLVTDLQYRGRAQLIRQTAEGYAFSATGLIKGQGNALCRLDNIPAEASVRVGDDVYTAERSGVQVTPLYYGRVVEVKLGDDDREWTILVKPVPLPTQLTTVHVLRMAVNPQRLAVK